MTFLGIDNKRDLPKVSYSTALDYFVATCFVFVVATVTQFAGVHFFTKFDSGEPMPDYCKSEYDEDQEEEQRNATIETTTLDVCYMWLIRHTCMFHNF